MKHEVYYCLLTDEIWIIAKSNLVTNVFIGTTWNGICHITKEHLDDNFYYIGEL